MGAGISETRRLARLEAVIKPSSDDRPEQSTNGTIKRLHDSSTRASHGFGDEQTLADSEQTLADSEQTLADSGQDPALLPGKRTSGRAARCGLGHRAGDPEGDALAPHTHRDRHVALPGEAIAPGALAQPASCECPPAEAQQSQRPRPDCWCWCKGVTTSPWLLKAWSSRAGSIAPEPLTPALFPARACRCSASPPRNARG